MPRLERRWRGVGLLVLGTIVAEADAGGIRFGVEAGMSHEGNVNRAVSSLAQSDQSVDLEGYAVRSASLGAHSGFVARVAVRGQAHRQFEALDALSALGRFTWRYQPTLTYTGPWFELNGSAEVRRHRDSPLRDGELLSMGIGVGKYMTDGLRTALGLSLDRRFASEGTVYDLSQQRLHATLDWRVGRAATLYGSAAWIRGDQVVTWAPGSGGGVTAPYRYSGRSDWYGAAARDPAFDGTGRLYSAYRTEAAAGVLDAGINWAFDGQTALDFGVTWFKTRADRGPAYDGFTVRAMFLHRFP